MDICLYQNLWAQINTDEALNATPEPKQEPDEWSLHPVAIPLAELFSTLTGNKTSITHLISAFRQEFLNNGTTPLDQVFPRQSQT